MPPKKQTFKPDPPKKSMCAFFLFRQDVYPIVKTKYEGCRVTEATREIGEMWKALDNETRLKYEAKAVEEKERVRQERDHYQTLYGKPESKKTRKRKNKKDIDVIKRYLNSRESTLIEVLSSSTSSTRSPSATYDS